MVRCKAKTSCGRLCKLHRIEGHNTCFMHLPKEPNPQLPFNNQSQAEILAEKKVNQLLWSASSAASNQICDEPLLIVSDSSGPLDAVVIDETTDKDKLCGHSCIGLATACCYCSDERPLNAEYTRHVEGLGDLSIGLRDDDYCESCKTWTSGQHTMPVIKKFNAIVSARVCEGKKKALGAFGLTVCSEIKDTIQQLVEIHNLLYTYSVEQTLTNSDTPDKQQGTGLHP